MPPEQSRQNQSRRYIDRDIGRREGSFGKKGQCNDLQGVRSHSYKQRETKLAGSDGADDLKYSHRPITIIPLYENLGEQRHLGVGLGKSKETWRRFVHPAGIKFGLSAGLLELRRADVVVSDV
jgi:hypothetical protein